MRVFVCFLSLIAIAVAGVIPGDIGAYSLNGLSGLGQATFTVNGINGEGLVLGSGANEGLVFGSAANEGIVLGNDNNLQTIELANPGNVITNVDDGQGLTQALQIICPDQPQEVGNLQFVQPQVQVVQPQVQVVQPQILQRAELNTFQVIKQAPAPAPELRTFQIVQQQPAPEPEIRYVKIVRQEPAPAPEVNYLQLVRQAPAPPPEVRTVQIVREHPAPPPQVRTVQIVREHPAPAPEVNTIQVITEAGEAPAPIESNVQIQQDDSGAQTVRFITDGEGGAEKVFRIVKS